MKSNKIINSEKSFPKIVKMLRKYFDNVKVINNSYSYLANRSQNFYKIILFENRGVVFSIKWNYAYCTLFLGDVSKEKHLSLQYIFTKIELNDTFPCEVGNNCNIVFYQTEICDDLEEIPQKISPLRMPIFLI